MFSREKNIISFNSKLEKIIGTQFLFSLEYSLKSLKFQKSNSDFSKWLP